MAPVKTLFPPAAHFLDRLGERGLSVSLRPDGKLWLEPKAALTTELLAEAKIRREDLVALLAGQNVEASAPASGA